MKAEERKEIETNSLVLTVQKMRERFTGRTLYYLIGTVAIVIAGILLYRYLTSSNQKARDAVQLQLTYADTPEKLKKGMEEHRGTVFGSQFKLNLARHELQNEGLPLLGTDNSEKRKLAAASVKAARAHFLELTGEFKPKDEPAFSQEAWLGAAKAEEALVGFPTAEGGTDSEGNVDKAIEYYEKAAALLPESEPSKRYKEWVEKIKANKTQFVATQKEIYKPVERPALPPLPPPGKGDPLGGFPLGGFPFAPPKGETPTTPIVPPPIPTGPKIEVPSVPTPPDPKKTPEPKPVDPPKGDPKAK